MTTAYLFPGQGSQQKGMGRDLFDEFPEITSKADEILGYPIKTLCLEDSEKQLGLTQFTQPALYTVNALAYMKKVKETGLKPDYVAGHSLGEYNALFAAGAFDFTTGLRLVKKRGELMSMAVGGGMAAVIGLSMENIEEILQRNCVDTIDVANINSPSQTVLAGRKNEIERIAVFFEMPGVMYIPLSVSGAFHSRYMEASQKEFASFINQFAFSTLTTPVISNVHARPHRQAEIKKYLVEQITHPVKWTETIRYLMGKGEVEFEEIGPGNVLTRLVQTIRKEAEPLIVADYEETGVKDEAASFAVKGEHKETPTALNAFSEDSCNSRSEDAAAVDGISQIRAAEDDPVPRKITPFTLGNVQFKKDYNLAYAYLAGSMYRGISSKEMIVKLGKAGIMGFLGAGGLDLDKLEESIRYIQNELCHGEPFGLNLLNNLNNPAREEQKVDIFLKLGVRTIEASAYLSITPALLRYRADGLRKDQNGTVSIANRIIAKVSRPEVAEAFLSPAPERLIEKMVRENKLTEERASLLREVPVADDLCVEADSGGHTDAGVAYALMPAMLKLRDDMMKKHNYCKKIRVGAAGGIGTPEAAAAAFVLGADFIMTGSINQCTVEAGTSEAVKDLLQQMNVQDTDYAPAGDMFEMGAKVQVLKKGLFFPARANKLFDLYRTHGSIDEIDEATRAHLQEKYFKRSFETLYEEIKKNCPPEDITKAERSPKNKMALIFKWYFSHTSRLALTGSGESRVDYQVHCGPALGAFNQWVKGTELEDWRNRRVDELGVKIMTETANLLNRRFEAFIGGNGVTAVA
ncbi:MAG TPA: ACP S-malonyltransferase [Geobacteraceae bacterium]